MVEFLMAIIRKVKLQKDCYQSVMKTTTKMTVLMTDLGLCKVWCQQERQLLYLGHPTFTDKYYQLYVFEENKKVWFLFDGETTPHLFFDKSK